MPRVLDAEGREIREGSRVTRPGYTAVGEVQVVAPGRVLVFFAVKPFWLETRRRFPLFGAYRCPDLLLAQSNDERSE